MMRGLRERCSSRSFLGSSPFIYITQGPIGVILSRDFVMVSIALDEIPCPSLWILSFIGDSIAKKKL
jgi:hypothetical protein